MMTGCDTLLTIGSSFPCTQFLPAYGQARGVQIDIDGRMIATRYPNAVNLVADAKTALRALIPHLTREDDRSWREEIEANVARWWETRDCKPRWTRTRSTPCGCSPNCPPRLPDDAIVTADSGSSANWYARQLRFRGNIRGSPVAVA